MADGHITGEGFVGEKILAFSAVVLTIVSSALLIRLTMMQHEHMKKVLAKQANKDSTSGQNSKS